MSYVVLARKYRPNYFDEVVGQSHITDLLKKSIESKRIAHAFLFCGPRGVGKTSCARILAKSLNCQTGPTLKPCEKCPACHEITLGNSFDVIEIDGASNRGIDEIRTLRENVKFAPSYGRYKIYIVDEVHMLTMEAFNALLKTLEEPPEHVKFIFATTEPQKVPSTIISRCQRFDFRRISLNAILDTLQEIAVKEKLKVDKEALFAIAKAAEGSLRDSLSILDQLSGLGQRSIKTEDVVSMLGLVEVESLFQLVDHLALKNCAAALEIFERIINQGKDIKQLARELIEHFRNLMIIKIGGKSLGSLVEYPVAIKEMFLTQSEKFTLKEILNIIDLLISSQETARVVESQRIPLELTFAKITLVFNVHGGSPVTSSPANPGKKETSDISSVSEQKNPPVKKFSPLDVLTNKKGYVDISAHTPDHDNPSTEMLTIEAKMAEEAIKAKQAPDLEKIRQLWNAITYAVSRQKMSVATYLQEGLPYQLDGNKLTISFPPTASFYKESLEQKDNLRLLENIFIEKLHAPISLAFRIVENQAPSMKESAIVEETLEEFKGKVVNKWHKE